MPIGKTVLQDFKYKGECSYERRGPKKIEYVLERLERIGVRRNYSGKENCEAAGPGKFTRRGQSEENFPIFACSAS
jgi:hypothetical protein